MEFNEPSTQPHAVLEVVRSAKAKLVLTQVDQFRISGEYFSVLILQSKNWILSDDHLLGKHEKLLSGANRNVEAHQCLRIELRPCARKKRLASVRLRISEAKNVESIRRTLLTVKACVRRIKNAECSLPNATALAIVNVWIA